MIDVIQNNRYYLDFNATSPYSISVDEYLKSGSYLSGNPSSIHSTGKKSKRFIRQTSDYLSKQFSLNNEFRTFFHSGATEGINTLLFGAAKEFYIQKKKLNVFVFETDHSSVINQKEEIEMLGHNFIQLPVNNDGDFDVNKIVAQINSYEGDKLLNFTWVNNETGVCWDLVLAEEIKSQTKCFIHVDAVQSIGKIDHCFKLNLSLDAYTFSAHKFGSLKGIGFSFVKESYPFHALIRGGGQQFAMRSGTENVDGIRSIELALEDVKKDFQPDQLEQATNYVLEEVKNILVDSGEIVALNSQKRNLNTIYLVLNNFKADVTTTAFDIAGIDLSSGSACSSGSILPSRVLLAMGYNESQAKSALRFSFPYNFNLAQAKELTPKLIKILQRYTK